MVDCRRLVEELSRLTVVEAAELAKLLNERLESPTTWPVINPGTTKKHPPSKEMTIIAIGEWARDDDNPIFPVGANPKRLLVCPTSPPNDGLIAGHRYLFKSAKGWKAGQLPNL
jgi:hypothetical protein